MLGVVVSIPNMLKQARSLANNFSRAKFANIVIAGMGGSAISGDIIIDLLAAKVALPIVVNRNYSLPAFVGPKTLFFALSYSGNTEETLTATKEALEKSAQVVCITSGGRLQELAQEKKLPCCIIPSGCQPRAALPYLLIPVLAYFEQAKLYPSFAQDLAEAISLIESLQQDYQKQAQQLAKQLIGKTPLIFATQGNTGSVGYRLKTQFNENSKACALVNVFPELNHNEIVNLGQRASNYYLLLLRDQGDSERINKRIAITRSLLESQLKGIFEIKSQGKSHLARLFSLIFFGDLLTVYLALEQGIDPTPVHVIEELKKELIK